MSVALLLHRADGAPLATPFRQAAIGAADPFGAAREIAWEGAGRMAAGRVALSGAHAVAAFPHIEMISVVAGRLTLTAAGAAPLVLEAGQGVVIGQGTALRIDAGAGATFVFCTATGSTSAVPGLTPLVAEANFKPSTPPPTETLLGETPDCRSDNVFTDASTRYRAGTWDSTPYHRIIRPHRLNELMHLLDGDVRFEAPDGSALTAGAGDVLFVPKGAAIGWESKNRVAKFYVVQEVDE